MTLAVFGYVSVGSFGDLSRAWLCYEGPFGDLSRAWLCYVGPLVTLAVLGHVMQTLW